jgi:hypothetical protein
VSAAGQTPVVNPAQIMAPRAAPAAPVNPPLITPIAVPHHAVQPRDTRCYAKYIRITGGYLSAYCDPDDPNDAKANHIAVGVSVPTSAPEAGLTLQVFLTKPYCLVTYDSSPNSVISCGLPGSKCAPILAATVPYLGPLPN